MGSTIAQANAHADSALCGCCATDSPPTRTRPISTLSADIAISTRQVNQSGGVMSTRRASAQGPVSSSGNARATTPAATR